MDNKLMEDMFKDAYFGKQYKTRDGRKAIYNYHSSGGYHDIIIDGEGMSYHFADHTNRILNLPILEECKNDVDYSSPIDIVSEWQEINEEELDKIASMSLANSGYSGPRVEEAYHKGFKAGYRKAKGE